ncbi:hypothetical protein Tco_0883749 [Tanacetum coccineum]
MSTLTFADTYIMAIAKANTVNGERQLQALVDKKRVIITESSIRSDLHLANAGGIDCFPTATIFEELARMGYEKPSQRLTFYKAFFSPQYSGIPTDSQQTTITTQPPSSRPQKKQSRRKQRKETEVPQDETHHDNSVPIPSNDPLLSGEDRMQLIELMILCTNLQKQVLDLEKAKDAQAKEIAGLKKRDKESLGVQEDASKHGRIKIVDETQGKLDDAEMFDTNDLHGDEVIVDVAVVTIADEGVTAAKINEITPTSAPTTVIDELTLAQTLIEIKAAKPKVVTTAATTTTTRPKARGVVVQEPSEFRTTTSSP